MADMDASLYSEILLKFRQLVTRNHFERNDWKASVIYIFQWQILSKSLMALLPMFGSINICFKLSVNPFIPNASFL